MNNDLAGSRFDKLLVKGLYRSGGNVGRIWKCLCDCGNVTFVRTGHLRQRLGGGVSCGCSTKLRTHGMSKTPEYSVWLSLRDRCKNPDNPRFNNYGARGISVCIRWDGSFENFIKDMGPRPSKNHSIDRIDNNGDYEPGNVRWATTKQQSRNKSDTLWVDFEGEQTTIKELSERFSICYYTLRARICQLGWSVGRAIKEKPKDKSPRMVTLDGVTMNLSQWARETGLTRYCISHRLDIGWSIEDTLTTPSKKRRNRGRKN